MTPEERYSFDVLGYLVVEDAIAPDYLNLLNSRLDVWEEKARQGLAERPAEKSGVPRSDSLTS